MSWDICELACKISGSMAEMNIKERELILSTDLEPCHRRSRSPSSTLSNPPFLKASVSTLLQYALSRHRKKKRSTFTPFNPENMLNFGVDIVGLPVSIASVSFESVKLFAIFR